MVGMALDGSGVMKEVEVHPDNVQAFKASGYKVGELPKEESGTCFTHDPVTEAPKPKRKGRK